jgi:integrase
MHAPKVLMVPFFPMTKETNVRTGFLSDEQYASLLKELPAELKPLFAVGYATGIRLGELKAIGWDQVDLNEGFITLHNGETKERRRSDGSNSRRRYERPSDGGEKRAGCEMA